MHQESAAVGNSTSQVASLHLEAQLACHVAQRLASPEPTSTRTPLSQELSCCRCTNPSLRIAPHRHNPSNTYCTSAQRATLKARERDRERTGSHAAQTCCRTAAICVASSDAEHGHCGAMVSARHGDGHQGRRPPEVRHR